jgi:hypothetical protein
MLNGDKIKIDALWTDYLRLQLPRGSSHDEHRIDLAQAEPIIRFIEYLLGKSTTDFQ